MSASQDSNRRVVITGMGLVSPLGATPEEYWDAVAAGTSGIRPVESLSSTALPGNIAGECPGFDDKAAKQAVPKKQRKFVKVMCREIMLGVTSAVAAMESGKIGDGSIDPTRLGVEFGANQMFSPPWVLKLGCYKCLDENGNFDYERWGDDGLAGMEPLWLLKYLPNMPACHIGIIADARGPNNSITMAEASANLALGEALRVLRRGAADVMIAGTGGTRLNPVKTIHANLWSELAQIGDGPETMSRPFDANRTGQVVGEGACSFIFEEEEHAKKRGVEIYGEVLGAGASCVIRKEGTPDLRLALANAMRAALANAGLEPGDVGHINAHGVGEWAADVAEAQAIQDVFGDLAKTVPVTSLKGHIGNSGAAGGTLELAASLLGLKRGVVPQTLNYETPDPDCPLNVVTKEPLPVDNKVFLNLSATAIGQASALVVCGA